MVELSTEAKIHPTDIELTDYLGRSLSQGNRRRVENHIASCDECLAKIVSAHESVAGFNKKIKPRKGMGKFMKKINLYLLLTIISFALSFIFPRYFIQSLVATLLLGTKWIVDSKTTKMLITIYEAWKTGEKEKAQASRLGQFSKKAP